jgi:glycosyltransferase involved in cell wall biosynthesis
MIPGPVVAYFGNSLGGGLLDALEEFSPKASVGSKDGGEQLMLGNRKVSFIFNSDYLRSYYQGVISDHFGRRRSQRYSESIRDHVVYDGADTDRFYPAGILPTPAVFAFLGRPVHPGKGFYDFCRAMTLLPEKIIGGIEVIGDGDQLHEGLDILKEGGRSHLLRHVGSASQDKVSKLLREASVMVLPTRDESIPIAVTEAMATGLAVVTSRLAGIPELFRDGEAGLLVDPGDLGQLVKACRRLAEEHLLTAQLGAAARALVVNKYRRRDSLERMAKICTDTFALARPLNPHCEPVVSI